jgi:hypothetical protein
MASPPLTLPVSSFYLRIFYATNYAFSHDPDLYFTQGMYERDLPLSFSRVLDMASPLWREMEVLIRSSPLSMAT